jgi:hypothetical protein
MDLRGLFSKYLFYPDFEKLLIILAQLIILQHFYVIILLF